MVVTITAILSLIFRYFIIVIYYYDSTMEHKKSQKQSHIISIALYFIYGGICIIGIPALNALTGIITLLAIIYYGYKSSFFGAAIRAILIMALVMFADLISSIIINVKFDSLSYTMTSPKDEIIFSCYSVLIFFVLITILRNISQRQNNDYRTPETLWLTILPITTCALMSFFNQIRGTISKPMEYFCIGISIALIISNLIVYVVCEHIIDKNIKIRQLQDAERRREIEELYSKVCGIRHDLKNHFTAIDALIDEEPQRAKQYIGALMQNQLQSIISFVKTDNDSFNAIANAKIAVCEREGIRVQTRIKNNALSRLSDDEIGIIFGNLFDNAIEAAQKSTDKHIELDVAEKNDYLSIVMTNSVDAPVLRGNSKLKTTKKNRAAHGFGTKNISRIVKKHNGMINYFEENGLFCCQILI